MYWLVGPMYGDVKAINVPQNIPRNDACLNPSRISMISCVQTMFYKEMSLKFAVELKAMSHILDVGLRSTTENFFLRELSGEKVFRSGP